MTAPPGPRAQEVTRLDRYRGAPFDVALRVTTVHRRRSGWWELVSWQSTRVP